MAPAPARRRYSSTLRAFLGGSSRAGGLARRRPFSTGTTRPSTATLVDSTEKQLQCDIHKRIRAAASIGGKTARVREILALLDGRHGGLWKLDVCNLVAAVQCLAGAGQDHVGLWREIGGRLFGEKETSRAAVCGRLFGRMEGPLERGSRPLGRGVPSNADTRPEVPAAGTSGRVPALDHEQAGRGLEEEDQASTPKAVSPREIAHLLWAAAKLERREEGLKIITHLMSGKKFIGKPKTTAVDISTATWAIGKLNIFITDQAVGEIFRDLKLLLHRDSPPYELRSFSLGSLAQVLFAFCQTKALDTAVFQVLMNQIGLRPFLVVAGSSVVQAGAVDAVAPAPREEVSEDSAARGELPPPSSSFPQHKTSSTSMSGGASSASEIHKSRTAAFPGRTTSSAGAPSDPQHETPSRNAHTLTSLLNTLELILEKHPQDPIYKQLTLEFLQKRLQEIQQLPYSAQGVAGCVKALARLGVPAFDGFLYRRALGLDWSGRLPELRTLLYALALVRGGRRRSTAGTRTEARNFLIQVAAPVLVTATELKKLDANCGAVALWCFGTHMIRHIELLEVVGALPFAEGRDVSLALWSFAVLGYDGFRPGQHDTAALLREPKSSSPGMHKQHGVDRQLATRHVANTTWALCVLGKIGRAAEIISQNSAWMFPFCLGTLSVEESRQLAWVRLCCRLEKDGSAARGQPQQASTSIKQRTQTQTISPSKHQPSGAVFDRALRPLAHIPTVTPFSGNDIRSSAVHSAIFTLLTARGFRCEAEFVVPNTDNLCVADIVLHDFEATVGATMAARGRGTGREGRENGVGVEMAAWSWGGGGGPLSKVLVEVDGEQHYNEVVERDSCSAGVLLGGDQAARDFIADGYQYHHVNGYNAPNGGTGRDDVSREGRMMQMGGKVAETKMAPMIEGAVDGGVPVTHLSLNGPTVMKHRIMRQAGFRLVAINQAEFERLDGVAAKAAFLEGKLLEVVNPAALKSLGERTVGRAVGTANGSKHY